MTLEISFALVRSRRLRVKVSVTPRLDSHSSNVACEVEKGSSPSPDAVALVSDESRLEIAWFYLFCGRCRIAAPPRRPLKAIRKEPAPRPERKTPQGNMSERTREVILTDSPCHFFWSPQGPTLATI